MVRINGENKDLDGKSLKEYLDANGYNVWRIAVEINEVIVPKADYSNTILAADDKVEIVSFVGGG